MIVQLLSNRPWLNCLLQFPWALNRERASQQPYHLWQQFLLWCKQDSHSLVLLREGSAAQTIARLSWNMLTGIRWVTRAGSEPPQVLIYLFSGYILMSSRLVVWARCLTASPTVCLPPCTFNPSKVVPKWQQITSQDWNCHAVGYRYPGSCQGAGEKDEQMQVALSSQPVSVK